MYKPCTANIYNLVFLYLLYCYNFDTNGTPYYRYTDIYIYIYIYIISVADIEILPILSGSDIVTKADTIYQHKTELSLPLFGHIIQQRRLGNSLKQSATVQETMEICM